MATTRRGLCSLATLALTSSAGCLDTLAGGPARFVAPLAPVADRALDTTGYELEDTARREERRTFEVTRLSREVEVVSRVAQYHRRIDAGPLGEIRGAVFVTLCTPAVSVLGRTFNPVEGMDNRELATEVQSQYEELSVGPEVDRRTVRLLDERVALSKFEGEATFGGVGIDVFVHTALAEGDDEFVVVSGIYPRLLPDEEGAVTSLAEGVRIEDSA
ncbi:DUF6517 family protein [Halalkalicoccus jeotgali]|uniref:Lipoprotein n=1 Tax=Halalkalicoccus jeotgali (strain DSM 18796 / CECT 7217 / JCM 14584 / KCTC 4019 / B3) TaxID=795797 RepID=D8J2X1_HALJB|nr:DUF6517 family protein [Halalkalicoccus jeotgali]ADJ15078.1 hypothetical protein HacjB3_08475 [Halalkalicoccus jeotgali B3]ELY34903.1 hypothetical protein C497_14227 [Halalkalicoccus jeotgali B3]